MSQILKKLNSIVPFKPAVKKNPETAKPTRVPPKRVMILGGFVILTLIGSGLFMILKKNNKNSVATNQNTMSVSPLEKRNQEALQMFQIQNFEKAIEIWDELLKTQKISSFKINKARALKELNKTEEATQELKDVLKTEPQNMYALNNLALLYLQTGKDDESLKLFEEILKLSQYDPQILLNIALAYEKNKKWNEARLSYLTYLKRQPASDAQIQQKIKNRIPRLSSKSASDTKGEKKL